MEIKCKVMPTFYCGSGKFGDWPWMKDQPVFAHNLFVFNDNEEQFDAYLAEAEFGYSAGAGNAVARPWRRLNPPKSAGVPTGKTESDTNTLMRKRKRKLISRLLLFTTCSRLSTMTISYSALTKLEKPSEPTRMKWKRRFFNTFLTD